MFSSRHKFSNDSQTSTSNITTWGERPGRESQTTGDVQRESEQEKEQQRERPEGGKRANGGETEGVGVFIGVTREEINKRGEKSLQLLRAPSPWQLKGPSKSPSNQRLNKDRSRRPRSCNLTPPALHSVAP